jgi:hypothetical protein
MAINIQATVGEHKYASGGALLTSGAVSTILGPTRVDRFFNRTFQVLNFGQETLSVHVDINLDQHGSEAHMGSAGAVAASPPNPNLWSTVASVSVSGGTVGTVTTTTPSTWTRLSATASLSTTTASGYLLAGAV